MYTVGSGPIALSADDKWIQRKCISNKIAVCHCSHFVNKRSIEINGYVVLGSVKSKRFLSNNGFTAHMN
jgi:hypothetical protein